VSEEFAAAIAFLPQSESEPADNPSLADALATEVAAATESRSELAEVPNDPSWREAYDEVVNTQPYDVPNKISLSSDAGASLVERSTPALVSLADALGGADSPHAPNAETDYVHNGVATVLDDLMRSSATHPDIDGPTAGGSGWIGDRIVDAISDRIEDRLEQHIDGGASETADDPEAAEGSLFSAANPAWMVRGLRGYLNHVWDRADRLFGLVLPQFTSDDQTQ